MSDRGGPGTLVVAGAGVAAIICCVVGPAIVAGVVGSIVAGALTGFGGLFVAAIGACLAALVVRRTRRSARRSNRGE